MTRMKEIKRFYTALLTIISNRDVHWQQYINNTSIHEVVGFIGSSQVISKEKPLQFSALESEERVVINHTFSLIILFLWTTISLGQNLLSVTIILKKKKINKNKLAKRSFQQQQKKKNELRKLVQSVCVIKLSSSSKLCSFKWNLSHLIPFDKWGEGGLHLQFNII